MRYLNKILILTVIMLIISIGGVSATDLSSVDLDNSSNSYDNYYLSSVNSNYVDNSSTVSNLVDMESNINLESHDIDENYSNNLGSSKVIKLTESNFYEYFNDDGYVDTTKVSPYDTLDLSGNFKSIEVMIFTIPVIVTSTAGDAYLKDCTIQFDNVIASKDKMAKVSNLKINNTIASGFNGVLATYSTYIEISNNTIYSESASGNPIRLLASNYINVINNVLETWYKSAELGFNSSWTHSCILLGESHYNYIASNDITVKESNPIYLSAYGCGPSNYNVIFNNTIKSSSKSEKTGLSNPSSWTYGVQLMGSYNKVLYNTIYNVFRGISSDGEYNEIIGNVLFNITGGYNEGNDGTSGGDFGIIGSQGSLIINNTIYDSKLYSFGGSGGAAIYVGAGSTVYGNKITVSASSRGIDIGASASNSFVYDNVINTVTGVGIYSLGYMNNSVIDSNTITSESGNGILIRKQSSSKYPTNLYITNNYILTGNEVFIDTSDIVDKSSWIIENNTCKKGIIVTKDNFFSYFDNGGYLKQGNIGVLVFKGSLDSKDLGINFININQEISILGNDVIIKNIQFNIIANNVNIKGINFIVENNSAIYLDEVNNISLVRNNINSSSLTTPIIVSKSFVQISSNIIDSDVVAILVNSESQVIIFNNLIRGNDDYTINLTNSGSSLSDSLKNNISNNCLVSNLKGDGSVSYSSGCKNNNIICGNEGIISNIIVNDTISFVNKNPILSINLVDFDGNPISGEQIIVNITDSKGHSTNYSVYTNKKGIALFNENLSVGNYTFCLVYKGNDIYKSSQVYNKNLEIIFMDTSLEVSDINTYYGSPIVIKATLKGNGTVLLDGKSIAITVNGKTYVNTTVNGVATFNIGTLPKGNYSVDYVFYDDVNCTGTSEKSKINVSTMPTHIESSDVVMFYQDGSGVIAYLKDIDGNGISGKSVSITLNGKTYKKTTDKDGKISLAVSLIPKTYTVSIKFVGDDNYIASSKSIKVQVKTRVTKIVASNLVKYYGDSKKLVVYLKDTNNKAVAGKSISIKINGKTYKKTTDKNGAVSLTLSLPKKTYTATIKFSATYHTSSSKSVKVSVVAPKITASSNKVKKGNKLNVVFKTYDGKIISGEKVYFKFGGKTYTLTTDLKGIATLTCNIKKGSYSVIAGFKSTAKYGSTKVTIKFKVI